MTVASATNRASYSGNGSTTAFAFSYPFRATSDLVVTVRTTSTGAESIQTEGTHYTVTGTPTTDAGGYASGTVTFVTAPASGTQVHIDREPARTQTTDYIAGDGIPPSSIEGSLDRLTLLVQDLESRLGRTLMQPRTAANRNLTLPEPKTSNAGQYFKVNSTGTAFEVSGTAPTSGITSLKDFGAVGNGTTDDSAAITAAEASSASWIYVPQGTYLTTKAPQQLTKVYWGAGKILLSNYATHKTPPVYTYISSEPTARITGRDPAQEFTGDFKSPLSYQQYVVGSATAGQPTTGYRNNPELSQIRAHCYTSAGYNHSTTGTAGRTSVAQIDLYHVMQGRGDAMNLLVGGYISNPELGRNSKSVSDPAITGLAGGFIATTDEVNIVCMEMQLEDNGKACTGAGVGVNLKRTVDPGANSKSYCWSGFSARATASTFPIDAGFHLSGNARIGLDLSAADFTADQGAIALASNQKIHFNAVNTSYIDQPEGTALGTVTLGYNSASTRFDALGADFNIASTKVFRVNGTQVVSARDTGWTAMTGTTNKATSYDTSTVTLAQLAGRVMAIQAALTTHGLLGT